MYSTPMSQETDRPGPVPGKIRDATELDYARAQAAAERIVNICDGAHYVAPEAMGMHMVKLRQICECVDVIVGSLRLVKVG